RSYQKNSNWLWGQSAGRAIRRPLERCLHTDGRRLRAATPANGLISSSVPSGSIEWHRYRQYRAHARCAVDLEFAAQHADAFLHSHQPERVHFLVTRHAYAIVLDSQVEPATLPVEFDMHLRRL